MLRVLWVNDNMFSDLWVDEWINRKYRANVDRASSTEEALKMCEKNKYELIVSNMRRGNDSDAGITLLEKLRKMGNETKYIVYTGREDRLKERRFLKLGGYGYTASETVVSAYIHTILTTAIVNMFGC